MIIFTRHAILKLEQRGIAKGLVAKTLKNPDKILSTHGDRMVAFKKFRKLYFKVVFRKENRNVVIITQHWTDKISP